MGACVLACSKDPRSLSDKEKKYLDHSPNPQEHRIIAQELENPPQKAGPPLSNIAKVEEDSRPIQRTFDLEDHSQNLIQSSLTMKKSRFCPSSLKNSSLTSTGGVNSLSQDAKPDIIPPKDINTLGQLPNEPSERMTKKFKKTEKGEKQNRMHGKNHQNESQLEKENRPKRDFFDQYQAKTSSARIRKTGVKAKPAIKKYSSFKSNDVVIEDSEPSPNLLKSTRGSPIVRASISKNPLYLQNHLLPQPLAIALNQTHLALIQKTLNFKTSTRLNEEVHYQDGSHYIGEWKQGMKNGKGKLVWRGGVYEGLWRNDQMSGQGKIIFENGEVFQGNFKGNKAQGDGTFTFSNGSIYRGHWKGNKQQGYGVHEWSSSEYYSGNWLEGSKNGLGELIFEDGSCFKGTFQNDQWHGEGEYQWQNKQTYKGQWKHNKKSGKGKLVLASGQTYEGEFQNDKYHGTGKLTEKDGKIYIGPWQNGKKQGVFLEVNPDGSKKRGFWAFGKFLFYEDDEEIDQKIKKMKLNELKFTV